MVSLVRRFSTAQLLLPALVVSCAISLGASAFAAGFSRSTSAGRVIYAFQGGNDGIGPASQLVVDKAGVLTGTTYYGGGTSCTTGEGGCGTTFSLTPVSSIYSESILYRFEGGSTTAPQPNGLITVKHIFYGSAAYGGAYSHCTYGVGCGFVYELTPSLSDYSTVILHSFNGDDGAMPESVPLSLRGRLYGTTEGGYLHCQGSGYNGSGCGAVYAMNLDGSGFTDLYGFDGGFDGWAPAGPLIADKSGALYGTTMFGGGYACAAMGCGTVFKLTPQSSGYAESILYRFRCCDDALNPAGGLLELHGALFGTTPSGGKYNNGTIFELKRGNSGYKETFLYSFRGGKHDGAVVNAELIADSTGTLYGTTQNGGGNGCGGSGCGTVFKLTPSSSVYNESILYRFEGGSSPRNPSSGLTLVGSGLFGTTFYGGNLSACSPNGCGTVYEISL